MSEENVPKGIPPVDAVLECPDLESMMRTYGNDVLRTAYMYVKDIHTAEDIFQEVFIKADRNKEGFRGESSVKTWLIRITVNACKDYLKSAYNRRVTPLQEFQENVMTSENDFASTRYSSCPPFLILYSCKVVCKMSHFSYSLTW